MNDLTSELYFQDTFNYVARYSPNLIYKGSQVSGNCTFCQHMQDNHHRYFGIWCKGGKVLLGCHNAKCGFGTKNSNGKGNNIYDFIMAIAGEDFDGALKIWCEEIGVPFKEVEERAEKIVQEEDIYPLCEVAFYGKKKWKYMRQIQYRKNLLVNQLNWEKEELFNEMYLRMREEFEKYECMNVSFFLQRYSNRIRSLYDEKKHGWDYEIPMNCFANNEEIDVEKDQCIESKYCLDRWMSNDEIAHDVSARNREALRLADKELTEVEKGLLRRDLTYREVAHANGTAPSTLHHRLAKKRKSIAKRSNAFLKK